MTRLPLDEELRRKAERDFDRDERRQERVDLRFSRRDSQLLIDPDFEDMFG